MCSIPRRFSLTFQGFVSFLLHISGLNQVVSEQAVDGPSPLDTMIQRLQQEQDQRLGANDTAASTNARAGRGRAASSQEALVVVRDNFSVFQHRDKNEHQNR